MLLTRGKSGEDRVQVNCGRHLLARFCNASESVWPTRRACVPKCWLGSNAAIGSVVELTGSSRARTPTEN
jgi:hypothetical protein